MSDFKSSPQELTSKLSSSYPGSSVFEGDLIIAGDLAVSGSTTGITAEADVASLTTRFSSSYAGQNVFLGDVILGSKNASNANLAVSGSVTVGADADGTDRIITFGHSTLKSVIGIDDSHDIFAINTDDAFETGNDLEISSGGNVTINNGWLQVADPDGIISEKFSGSSGQTSVLLGDLILGTKNAANANLYVSGNVGVGTSAPDHPLHVKSTTLGVTVMIDAGNNGSGTNYDSALALASNGTTQWQVMNDAQNGSANRFLIRDAVSATSIPFVIEANAPNDSIVLKSTGLLSSSVGAVFTKDVIVGKINGGDNADLSVSGSVTIDTDTTTATALTITADSFTGTSSGGPRKLINISTNTSDTDKIVMLSLQNDHASATGCTPVSIRQDAVSSGTYSPFMKMMAGGSTDYLEVKYKQLQITCNTGGTTTTSSNFFEANAVPFLFSIKVTTAIGNNGYISKIGVTNDDDIIAGTLSDGLLEEENDHLVFSGFDSAPAAGWPINGSAQNLVIEHNATPDAGVVYVDMWYYVLGGLGG